MDLKVLARPQYTDHFTGADLKALLCNTQLKLAHDLLDQKQKRERLSSLSSSAASPPKSLESSPEVATSAVGCEVTSYFYDPTTGLAQRYTALPEDVEEKVSVLWLCCFFK